MNVTGVCATFARKGTAASRPMIRLFAPSTKAYAVKKEPVVHVWMICE